MAFQAQGVSFGTPPARRRQAASFTSPAAGAHGSSTGVDRAPHSRSARRFRSMAAMCFCFYALLTALSLLISTWQNTVGGSNGTSCRKASNQQPRIQRVAYTSVVTNYSTGTAAAGTKGSSTFNVAEDKYTIIINSFRRHVLLKAALAHYCACPQADAIHVVWSEDSVGPPTASEDASYYCTEDTEVVYDLQPTSSLNNRFAPVPGLRTPAILSMDDDIRCVLVFHLLMSSAPIQHRSTTLPHCGASPQIICFHLVSINDVVRNLPFNLSAWMPNCCDFVMQGALRGSGSNVWCLAAASGSNGRLVSSRSQGPLEQAASSCLVDSHR